MSARPTMTESIRRVVAASDALGAVLALDFDLLTVDEDHELQTAQLILERVASRYRTIRPGQ